MKENAAELWDDIYSIITFFYLHCKKNIVADCYSDSQHGQDINDHITKARFIHCVI